MGCGCHNGGGRGRGCFGFFAVGCGCHSGGGGGERGWWLVAVPVCGFLVVLVCVFFFFPPVVVASCKGWW